MRNHISRILSRFFSSKTLLLCVCLALLFALVPMQFAQAIPSLKDMIGCMAQSDPILITACIIGDTGGFGGIFTNAVVNGIAGAVDIVVGLIADTVKVIAELVAKGMEAFITMFMQIPISPNHEGTPQVIKTGFNFSRQLVNMLFILILTFIGLSTILRIKDYQLQTTLRPLIIVALLVNFSGLLVGFMTDIGNIITNAFLKADDPLGSLWKLGSIPGITGAAGLGTHIVEIIYYLISLLVYFVVVLLFGVRVLVLWTLVILAPLAAGLYILPATKKYWSQWFGQLIQWSMIGIPISFTLMLAKKVMAPGGFSDTVLFPGSALANLAAPFTALFLLFFGITTSIALAPAYVQGAKGIIERGKQWGKNAGAFAGRLAWNKAGGGLEKLGKNIRRRGEGEKPELTDLTGFERSKVGKVLGKGFGFIGKGTGEPGRFITRWAGRGIERGSGAITAQVVKKPSESFAKAKADATNANRRAETSLDVIAAELIKPEWARDKAKIAGTIAGMRDRNDYDEIEKAINEKNMFRWDQIGKNVVVPVSDALGSYGRRPVTLGNPGPVMAQPEVHGYKARPITDPKVPGRVIGFETLDGRRLGDEGFKNSDAEWLTDNYLHDVFQRLEPGPVKTNGTAPLGNKQPFDVEINPNTGQPRLMLNALSSQAFEHGVVDSARAEIINPMVGLREGKRAQAVVNLWRNRDPLDLVKGGSERFLVWLKGTEATNIGVGTQIPQQKLDDFISAVKTGRLTQENLNTLENADLRRTYDMYVSESKAILYQFLQTLPIKTGTRADGTPIMRENMTSAEATQVLNQLLLIDPDPGKGTWTPPPTGFTPPPGYDPTSHPLDWAPTDWTPGSSIPPGWTWTPPPPPPPDRRGGGRRRGEGGPRGGEAPRTPRGPRPAAPATPPIPPPY